MSPPSSGNMLEVRGVAPCPNPRKAPASLAVLGRLGSLSLELELQYERSGDISLCLSFLILPSLLVRLLSDSI